MKNTSRKLKTGGEKNVKNRVKYILFFILRGRVLRAGEVAPNTLYIVKIVNSAEKFPVTLYNHHCYTEIMDSICP